MDGYQNCLVKVQLGKGLLIKYQWRCKCEPVLPTKEETRRKVCEEASREKETWERGSNSRDSKCRVDDWSYILIYI